MTQLIAEGIGKSYHGRDVVKSVSLSMQSGEVVGLLGPNGAGKTTCFYMLTGLVTPARGRITLDSLDITTAPIHERSRAGIGYLPQEASIFRQLSVHDNIMAIVQLRRELGKADKVALCDRLLDEFNLNHIRDSLGISLSGGERRRVEIARALALDPKFILLDEPFAGVDPISIKDIKAIVTDLQNRGIGVLITDHNVRETLQICHRAYILAEGNAIAEGKPADLLSNTLVRKTYLGEEFSI